MPKLTETQLKNMEARGMFKPRELTDKELELQALCQSYPQFDTADHKVIEGYNLGMRHAGNLQDVTLRQFLRNLIENFGAERIDAAMAEAKADVERIKGNL